MPEPAAHHCPRADAFGLLPEEDPAAWTRHVLDLRECYRPVDATETKLVTAIAAAMWMEIRADRLQAEVLADIRPACPGRSHGSDLQDRDHAAALSTVIRFATAAGCASAPRPARLPRPPQGQGRRPDRAGVGTHARIRAHV